MKTPVCGSFMLGFAREVVAGAILLVLSLLPTLVLGQTLYETDDSGIMYAITPGGSVSVFASGFGPANGWASYGLAINSTGTLFVSNGNSFNGKIYEVTPGGSVSTFASGLDTPLGLAFNSTGTLFVANDGNGTVSEVTPGGSVSTFASGFNGLTTLAFNGSGTLFVAADGNGQNGNGTISKVTPGGSVSTFASGFDIPYGLAFNGTGTLFVVNIILGNTTPLSGYISEVTPGGVVSAFGGGFSQPFGLAISGNGTLFVADNGDGAIYEVTPEGSENTLVPSSSGLNPEFLAFGTVVPEPADTAAIMGLAVFAAAWWRRNRMRLH